MNPETDIICLELVKGIPKAPGDTESAEQPLVTLDLLDANGLSVQTNGWTPALPGIKRGGTWSDSQLTDGRRLIAGNKDNVTETMNLAISNTDLKQRFQILGKLNQLLDDAREFWVGGYQLEPVYLKFKAACASVYQYALIYNGTVAQDNDAFEESNPWQVTLTFERESAWRMVVPPGGNPIEYHFWSQGKERGIDYTYTDMNLGSNADHVGYGELPNVCEFNGADKTTFLTEPWIDLLASQIPGDAPALVCAVFRVYGEFLNQLHMALSTEPPRRYDRDIDEYAYTRNTLNAGDATVATKVVDDCGALSNDQIVDRYIHSDTVAAATVNFTEVISWTNASANPSYPLHLNQMSGEWALYLRSHIASGSDGDVEARLVFDDSAGLSGTLVTLPYAQIPSRSTGVTCANEFDLVYMGRMKFPLTEQPFTSFEGFGLAVDDQNAWQVAVEVRNTAGADRVFEVIDLIFIPIHEGYCIGNPDALENRGVQNGTNNDLNQLILDNTGYFNHGHTDDSCLYQNLSYDTFAIQLLGNIPRLKPGVDNRLYFIQRFWRTGNAYQVAFIGSLFAGDKGPVRINIVPRCYGIADL
jgi:hypothetical protein